MIRTITCTAGCFRVRVQATFVLLGVTVHKSDPAELSKPSGQQEVEKEVMGLESHQSNKGVCWYADTRRSLKREIWNLKVVLVV